MERRLRDSGKTRPTGAKRRARLTPPLGLRGGRWGCLTIAREAKRLPVAVLCFCAFVSLQERCLKDASTNTVRNLVLGAIVSQTLLWRCRCSAPLSLHDEKNGLPPALPGPTASGRQGRACAHGGPRVAAAGAGEDGEGTPSLRWPATPSGKTRVQPAPSVPTEDGTVLAAVGRTQPATRNSKEQLAFPTQPPRPRPATERLTRMPHSHSRFPFYTRKGGKNAGLAGAVDRRSLR